jgi:hypothetical protein
MPGCVTAARIVTARDVHRIELPGPVGADTVHGRPEAGHNPQSAFHVDWDTRQVTCPQQITSVSRSDQRRPAGIQVHQVHFAATDRAPCPRRPDCTTAKNHKWGRTLTLRPREQQQALWQRRAEQETEEWKARCNLRADVEGTISQAVRRTRYTGLAKTHPGNVLAATALNLVRLDAWLTGTPLGKTRTSHLAALDLAA